MGVLVHCLKCNNKEFPDISSLRKHQWAEHKKMFQNAGKPTKKAKWSRAQRAKYKATIAAKNGSVRGFLNGAIPNNKEMSAREVLDELKKQRDFMNDIVDMVENLIK